MRAPPTGRNVTDALRTGSPLPAFRTEPAIEAFVACWTVAEAVFADVAEDVEDCDGGFCCARETRQSANKTMPGAIRLNLMA